MPAAVANATAGFFLTVHETPASPPTGGSALIETRDFNKVLDLLAAGTPPVTRFVNYPQATLSSGTLDIDLTAAQGSDGAVDCTGKKLVAWVIDATNCANQVAVAAGPSNGFAMNGVTVEAGAAAILLPKAAGAAVGGSNKIIRLTGTGAQVPKFAALFG
ncbi:MAG: hypothetical protein HYX69_18665 [Planctomycetia bacterium]|nr:hypothetical protein [Planctomycetia bacterium]